MKTKLKTIFYAVVVALPLLAGCGGGGGRGGEARGPVLSLTSPAANSTVTDVEFNNDAFRIEVTFADQSGISMATLRATIKVDNESPVDITSYFARSGNKIVTDNISEVTKTLFDVRLNDRTRKVTVVISLDDVMENPAAMTAEFIVVPGGGSGGSGGTPPAPPPGF